MENVQMANINLRAKEDGKEKTGEILPVLSPFHGSCASSPVIRVSRLSLFATKLRKRSARGRESGESIRFEFI